MHKDFPRESIKQKISLLQKKVSSYSSIIDKIATLRMNKSFMIFVQNNKNKGNIIFITGLVEIVDLDEEVWC